MADPNVNFRQNVSPSVIQRTVMVGRVKMAQAIKMPESEWARMLADIEKDPLFQELLNARAEGKRIIRFKRFAHTQIAGQFYESQDMNVVGGGESVSAEALLEHKQHLLSLIQKIGQEAFEKHFLYREGNETPEEIAAICNITPEQAKELQEFIVDVSVQSEFYHPSGLSSEGKIKPTVVGRIVRNNDGTFSIAYFSPHLARGLYEIDRDALRRWQQKKNLDRTNAARLRKYVGVLELANMKQGSFWRVMDHLLKAQKAYFETKDVTKLSPVSLRKVAATLQFAPSTLSRVLANKSVLLPWDHEVLILDLMPGQRKVLLDLLEHLLAHGKAELTDMALSREIQREFGLKISRRTVTACRHVLLARQHLKAA